MIEGIGTTWMRVQDKPIAQMDMNEARSMMCAKSNGQPEACEKCPGWKSCQAGQRVTRLRGEDDRAIFQAACESGNAWNWLMIHKGLGKDAAGELLSRLIRKFPGLAADYGGGRRIMQRPRPAKQERPVEPQEGPQTASGEKVEQMAIAEAQAPEKAPEPQKKSNRGVKSGAKVREITRETARAAFAHDDPIAYLMETERCSYHTARQRVKRWAAGYPDIAGDYKLPDSMRGRRKTGPEPEKEEEPMENTDEISLADFLEEHAEITPEPQPKPEPEKPTGIAAELKLKYDALAAEKKRLEERIRWIEEQQEALAKVASMFGERAEMYAGNTAT